jgi:V-type H+-transporting ATPase subunit a
MVRFFATQIEKEQNVVPVRALMDSAPLITVGPHAAHTIDELDVALKEHEARLIQMNNSYQTLSERTHEGASRSTLCFEGDGGVF